MNAVIEGHLAHCAIHITEVCTCGVIGRTIEQARADRARNDDARPAKLITIHGNVREIDGANLSDIEVAGRVRMLMRTDVDHEAVCVMARDRIVWLSSEVARLKAELEARTS